MTAAPARTGGGARAIARNLGWMLASRGVLAVLSLLYLAVATRSLGIADFGRFSLIAGAAQALSVFVGFQTWQIIVRYGTDHLRGSDDRGLAQLLRACGLLDAGSAVAGMLIAALVITRWGEALGVRPVHARATFILAAVQLLAIRSTPLGILRMRDLFKQAALADSVTPVVRLVAAVAAAVVKPTVTGFVVAWGLAEVLTAAAYWVLVARTGDLGRMVRRGTGLRGVVAAHPGILRFSLGTNVNATLGLGSKQVPLLLVGGIGGPAVAGAFRLALQVAQALTKLSQLLARAAFPEFVRAIGGDGIRRIGALVMRSVAMTACVAVIVFVVIVAGGRFVLTAMGGADFASAYPALVWLAGAGCIDLVTAGFEPLLLAANRTGQTLVARFAGMAALVGVSIWLSPAHGMVGVAAAALASSLAVALLLAGATVRLLRAEPRAA